MNAKRQKEYRQRKAEQESQKKYKKIMKDLHGHDIDE
jgi:hypothetical protein